MKIKINSMNVMCILLIFLLMILKNFIVGDSILKLVVLFLMIYFIFFIHSYKKLGSIKKLFLSADFIYESIFVFYSVIAAIMFIIDGYQPRIRYFLIDYNTIYETLNIYYLINCLFLLLILIFNGPKYININDELFSNFNKSSKFTIFDFFATLIIVYYYYLHFRNGLSIFGMYFQDLRLLIKSDINANLMNYLFLFMIIYSFLNITKIIYKNRKKTKLSFKELFVILLLLLFWGLSLLTGRRNLINLLVMLIIAYAAKIKRLGIKKVLLILFVFVIFLSLSFFRSGEKFSKEKFNDFIFLSNGEFVLVHYVSEFYYNYPVKLRYGSTYIYDTICAFIPRKVYPNKPKMLSNVFVDEAKTNVGYAYNPVAEGFINFGTKGAIFVVPLVLYFFVQLAYTLGKKNSMNYIIICGYAINFYRGTFSVTIFALVLMFISSYLLLKTKRIRQVDK